MTFGKGLTKTQADAAQAMDLRRQQQIAEQRKVIERLLNRNRELEQALKDAGIPLPSSPSQERVQT